MLSFIPAGLMSWFFLGCAIVFEVGGTSIMKISQGGGWFLSPKAGLMVMFLLVGLSYYCLSLAVRKLAVGVAFAFWEGLGLVLITLVSVFALGESMSLPRALALAAVLGGAMLVHHGTEDSPEEEGCVVGCTENSATPADVDRAAPACGGAMAKASATGGTANSANASATALATNPASLSTTYGVGGLAVPSENGEGAQ